MNSYIFVVAFLGCLSVSVVHAADTVQVQDTNTQQHLRTQSTSESVESAEPNDLWSAFEDMEHRRILAVSRPTCTAGCEASYVSTNGCESCFAPKTCKQVNKKKNTNYCHDGCLYDGGASYRMWLMGSRLACVPACTVKECEGQLSGADVGSLFTAKVVGSKIELRWKKSYFKTGKVQLCFHNLHTAQCKSIKTSSEKFTDKRSLVMGREYGYRLCETGKKFPTCRRVQVRFN